MMIKFCDGIGLRVIKAANLNLSDIDSGRMMVLVRCSKKDCYVPLPETIL